MNLTRLLAEAERRGLIDPEDPEDVDADVAEAARWAALYLRTLETVQGEAVPEQRAFMADASLWSTAVCSRQCGKGWCVARMLVLEAMREPDGVCIYVRRTLGLAKTTMWLDEPRDGIPAVLEQLGLVRGRDYTLNLSSTSVHLANGSIIRLVGHERRVGWTDARGHKFRLMVLDEMQEQEDEGLRQALTQDIPYCFMRYGGRFVGIGTPGEFPVGPFHDITEHVPDPDDGHDQGKGWAIHRWTAEALKDKTPVWDGMLRWKADFNVPDSSPKWRRDARGEWATDDMTLILPCHEASLWDGLTYPATVGSRTGVPVPRSVTGPGELLAYGGIDFGFTAPTALVVVTVSREEGVIREVYSEPRPGLDNDQLGQWVQQVQRELGVRLWFADDEDPGAIRALQVLRGVNVVAAEKMRGHAKEFYIQEMRAHMATGRLQVRRGSPLHDELKVLSPDPALLKARRIAARAGLDDHCYDALRYVFKNITTNHVSAPEPPMTPGERAVEEELEHRRRVQTGNAGPAGSVRRVEDRPRHRPVPGVRRA